MSNTELLENVLNLAPTTFEMGLTPLQLLHLDSQDSLQDKIAALVAARDASDRYSAIQIMSSDELKFLLDTLGQSLKADNAKLRALVYYEDSETIYMWNDKRCRSRSKTGII